MSDTKSFLDDVYDVASAEERQRIYARWSKTYDEELAESGYFSPERCAAALAASGGDRTAPLLDLGCGTGLSGAALRAAGFDNLTGADTSPEMVREAKAKQIYRQIHLLDAGDPLTFERGAFTNIAAIGVLTPGHAPPETIDRVLAILPRGGRFAFSLNDHALHDGRYRGRVLENVDTGYAQIEFREHGPHLPRQKLDATVYVLRRM